jgi:hypothetical protein
MTAAVLLLLLAEPPRPTRHDERSLAGWAVRVDARLAGTPVGDAAVGLLEAQLRVIAATVPADKVARLRRVAIWLDLTHGRLVSPQYHVGPGWLTANGYDPRMADAVHLPHAGYFAGSGFQRHQPSAVLHELAHAYHHQVLGVDHPGVRAGWRAMRQGGKYDRTLTAAGGTRRHYALTNPQEFFAELTESYLGRNDFYPFNAGELRQAEPALFALMQGIWGPLP